jgi:hypothetical protein
MRPRSERPGEVALRCQTCGHLGAAHRVSRGTLRACTGVAATRDEFHRRSRLTPCLCQAFVAPPPVPLP